MGFYRHSRDHRTEQMGLNRMDRRDRWKTFSRHLPHSLYMIIDPRDGAIFYIGMTYNLDRRIKDHLRCRPHAASSRRIAAILAAGLKPDFQTVAHATDQAAALRLECSLIAYALQQGHQLDNNPAELREARALLTTTSADLHDSATP